MTNILNTRADLMQHPAFAGADTDFNGNPIVWINHYSCPSSTTEQDDWVDSWSSGISNNCQNCGKAHAPYKSDWVGPDNPYLRRLWQALPEAVGKPPKAEQWTPSQIEAMKDQNMSPAQIVSRINMIKTAAKVKKLIDEMDADPEQCQTMKAERDDGNFYTTVGSKEYKRAQAIINGDMSRRLMAAASTDYVAFDPKKTNIKEVMLNARQLGKTETFHAMLKHAVRNENHITQRSAPAWAWDMIDGLLGLGLGDDADLSAVAMKFATENQEYAELTREDAKRAAGVL